MHGIAEGQYIRAVLADGIGAGLPLEEIGSDELYRTGGVVVGFNRTNDTVIIVDPFDNEHQVWAKGAEHVDPMSLPDEVRDWAIGMQIDLSLARASRSAA